MDEDGVLLNSYVISIVSSVSNNDISRLSHFFCDVKHVFCWS